MYLQLPACHFEAPQLQAQLWLKSQSWTSKSKPNNTPNNEMNRHKTKTAKAIISTHKQIHKQTPQKNTPKEVGETARGTYVATAMLVRPTINTIHMPTGGTMALPHPLSFLNNIFVCDPRSTMCVRPKARPHFFFFFFLRCHPRLSFLGRGQLTYVF